MLLCVLFTVLCLLVTWLLLVTLFCVVGLCVVVLFVCCLCRCMYGLLSFVCYGMCLWFGLFFYFEKETGSFVVFAFDCSVLCLCFVVARCVCMSFVWLLVRV